MNDIVLGLIVGATATFILGYVLLKIAERKAEDNLEKLLAVIQHLQTHMILARVEEHQGVFYVYNVRDDSFMAQGVSIDELRERIEQRWPQADVSVTEGDQAVLERLRSTGKDVSIG